MPTFLPERRGVQLSEALAEAYAVAPEDVVILHTLEFLHSAFVDDDGNPSAARIVKAHDPITATLESTAPVNASEAVMFVGVDFEFSLPDEGDDGSVPEIQVKIDNVAKYLIPYLDLASESLDPITVIYRPYLSTDLSLPHVLPPLKMTLRGISADVFAVTATASFGDLANRRFPFLTYKKAKFPGLSAH